MAEDAFVTDFEHIMADDITDDVRFIMYDSASGKTASAGEVSKYMMRNIHVDTTLTEEGAAAEAKAVGDALAMKANTKGTYEDLIAGGAEQLMADGYESDSEPYLFRPTGGSADVGNREYLDKIVGGTVAWNQLVSASATSVTVQSGHKYIAKIGGAWSVAASSGSAISVTGGSDMLIDLTAMFGTTIADYIYNLEQSQAGAGVAWLKAHGFIDGSYRAFDSGSLQSVKTSEHRTVGKNLLPQRSASVTKNGITVTPNTDGSITISGTNTSSGTTVIPFSGDTTPLNRLYLPAGSYIISANNFKDNCWVGVYKNSDGAGAWSTKTIGTGTFTVEGGDYVFPAIRIVGSASFSLPVTVYPMIRFASVSDATFEPYHINSYPLDPNLELRGLFKLDANNNLYADGDVYESSGAVSRKYGIVDLGTLYWNYNTSGGLPRFISGGIASAVKIPQINVIANIVSTYVAVNFNTIYAGSDKSIAVNAEGKINISDSAYTDAQSFKTAMSGVYLVYELATPTTETAEGYEQYQICDPSGTEEYVTTGIVPVGHETRYPHDLKKKIETAPDSPSTDGTYFMKRSGGKNTYMALPSTPSANGAYVLTVTVSGGTASYSWTAKE